MSDKIDFTTFNGDVETAAIADSAVTSAKFASGLDPIISTSSPSTGLTLDTYKSGKKHLYGIKTLATNTSFGNTWWTIFQRTSAEKYNFTFGTTISVKSIQFQAVGFPGLIFSYQGYDSGTSLSSIEIIPVKPQGNTGSENIRVSVDIWGS